VCISTRLLARSFARARASADSGSRVTGELEETSAVVDRSPLPPPFFSSFCLLRSAAYLYSCRTKRRTANCRVKKRVHASQREREREREKRPDASRVTRMLADLAARKMKGKEKRKTPFSHAIDAIVNSDGADIPSPFPPPPLPPIRITSGSLRPPLRGPLYYLCPCAVK